MDKTLPHEYQKQINGWYCGPAAVRVALSCWISPPPSQQTLAAQLGTTTNGTNSSEDVVRVMNAWLGAGTYASRYISGSDSSPPDTVAFRWLTVASINKGYAVVCNVVGPISPIGGGWYSYPGGHYVTVVGYQADGELVLVADIDKREYWVTVEQMATWIASRGYAYGAKEVAAPTPPPAPAPAPPVVAPIDTSTVYIIDIASYQEGLLLDEAKAHGVQAVNIKTSEGMGYTWNGAKRYADLARSLGLGISTFHWLDSSGSGVAQARRAFDLMKYLGNGSTDGMAHQCDCEDDANYTIFAEYVTEFQRLLGRPIFLYTGDWWWTSKGNWNGAQHTPYLWAAPNDGYLGQYPGDNSPHWNAGYGGWDVLSGMQFAVTPIPGFNGNVSRTKIRTAAWNATTGRTTGLGEGDDDVIVIFRAAGKLWKSNGLNYQEIPDSDAAVNDIIFWLGQEGHGTVTDLRPHAADNIWGAVPEHVFGRPVDQVIPPVTIPPVTIPPITVPPATVDYDKIKETVKQAAREGTGSGIDYDQGQ